MQAESPQPKFAQKPSLSSQELILQFKDCNPAHVLLNTTETAIFLRVSNKKLEADRLKGTGPPFKKVGAKVIYCLKELLEYLDGNTRLNTCK